MTITTGSAARTPRNVESVERVVIRFAGDSGDGMQLAGEQFTSETAALGNDLSTLPDFPAEIRAPAGTIGGVSGFQLHFASRDIATPGDAPDVLVAMNPAALKANLRDVPLGKTIIVNTDEFSKRNLAKVGYEVDPLTDESLSQWNVVPVPLTSLTIGAVEKDSENNSTTPLGKKDSERCKNMFILGLMTWLYDRPTQNTVDFIKAKFLKKPLIAAANVAAFNAGWAYGETTEVFATRYEVAPSTEFDPGTYRNIHGNLALSYGLVAGAQLAELPLFLGSYPITPASDILHELSKLKHFNVRTFQAEDELAAIGAALGAAYGGALGLTTTSGPGVDLKSETLGLAMMLELPLILVDIQRGGPSTGLPTKTEQADLLMAMFGRHGEAPVPIVAAATPADCFNVAIEAVRIATQYSTPVIILSDGYIANGSEPWNIPEVADLPKMPVTFTTELNGPEGQLLPYLRDPETLARPWIIPGTKGLEHRIGGLEKADGTGAISYDTDNHDKMVRLRQAKIDGIEVPDITLDDPHDDSKLLVLGWGSTFGPMTAAVRRIRQRGLSVAQAHLRHLNPFPKNLGDILTRYDRVLIPEMNLGQLAMLVRAKYLVDAISFNQVRGLPFRVVELEQAILANLEEMK